MGSCHISILLVTYVLLLGTLMAEVVRRPPRKQPSKQPRTINGWFVSEHKWCQQECKDQPGEINSVCGNHDKGMWGISRRYFRNLCEIDCMNKEGLAYKNAPMEDCMPMTHSPPNTRKPKIAWGGGTSVRYFEVDGTTPTWTGTGNTDAMEYNRRRQNEYPSTGNSWFYDTDGTPPPGYKQKE